MSGVKRSSPGADAAKNILGEVVLSDEDAKKLDSVNKKISRVDLMIRECSVFVRWQTL